MKKIILILLIGSVFTKLMFSQNKQPEYDYQISLYENKLQCIDEQCQMIIDHYKSKSINYDSKKLFEDLINVGFVKDNTISFVNGGWYYVVSYDEFLNSTQRKAYLYRKKIVNMNKPGNWGVANKSPLYKHYLINDSKYISINARKTTNKGDDEYRRITSGEVICEMPTRGYSYQDSLIIDNNITNQIVFLTIDSCNSMHTDLIVFYPVKENSDGSVDYDFKLKNLNEIYRKYAKELQSLHGNLKFMYSNEINTNEWLMVDMINNKPVIKIYTYEYIRDHKLE